MSERDRQRAEAGRVKAEQARVKAEQERIAAEGHDPLNGEPARRQGEQERIDAEAARERRETRRELGAEELRTTVKGEGRRDLVIWGSLLVALFGFGFWGVRELVVSEQKATDALQGALERLDATTAQINAAAIKNCADNNETKRAQRRSLRRGIASGKDEIVDTRTTDPSLFPDIPPKTFERLIQEEIDKIRQQQEKRRADLRDLDRVKCEKRFP